MKFYLYYLQPSSRQSSTFLYYAVSYITNRCLAERCNVRGVYVRVTQITSQHLYQFMKDNQISPLNYRFDYYFDTCVEVYDIKVLEHHFSNSKIEGLIMIDDQGISFSYEK